MLERGTFYLALTTKALVTKDKELVNALNNDGEAPLFLACKAKNKDHNLIAYLVDSGADVNEKNQIGSTPLQIACQQAFLAAVEVLLKKGADVDAPRVQARGGGTSLHAAVEMGQAGIVKLLVANGADVNAKNVKGKTPAQVIAMAKKILTLEELKLIKDEDTKKKAEENNKKAEMFNKNLEEINKNLGDNKLIEDGKKAREEWLKGAEGRKKLQELIAQKRAEKKKLAEEKEKAERERFEKEQKEKKLAQEKLAKELQDKLAGLSFSFSALASKK